MATGLSLAEALRVMAHITSSPQAHAAFALSPEQVLTQLGIDADAALNGCKHLMGGQLAPLDQLRQSHDAMVGRLLTAHLSHQIHGPG